MTFHRDELNKVICCIRIPTAAGEENGTGIFIVKNNMPFLVTAAHVVKNINPQAYVILSDQAGNPTKVLLIDLLQGATFDNHPQADIAKVGIAMTAENVGYLQNRCFPFEQINIASNPISKDTELTTVGFPMGLGAQGAKFSPLSFRTFIAAPLLSLNRFDIQTPCDFIILESPAMGGYSGGPLFDLGYRVVGSMTTSTGDTTLHGIVHGTISDKTGGKLAAITPCSYLNGWF